MKVHELINRLRDIPQDADIQVGDIEYGSLDDEGGWTYTSDFQLVNYYRGCYRLEAI